MKDRLKRTLRTFAQAFFGTLATLGIPILYNLMQEAGKAGGDIVKIDVNVWGNILIACVVAGVISVITFVQNALEDQTGKNLLPK